MQSKSYTTANSTVCESFLSEITLLEAKVASTFKFTRLVT